MLILSLHVSIMSCGRYLVCDVCVACNVLSMLCGVCLVCVMCCVRVVYVRSVSYVLFFGM